MRNSDNKIQILTETQNWIAIAKPAGILVYTPPHFKKEEDTIVDLFSNRVAFAKKTERNGIVHRLDRETSGVLLIAKNERAEEKLKYLFKNREIIKKYLVLVWGNLEPREGTISIPLGRDSKKRLKIVPSATGKPSITEYKVIKNFPKSNMTLCEVNLKTGRTHQIRVHFAAIGHEVVGDQKYSRNNVTLKRQFLHAKSLEFKDPFTKELQKIESELPTDLDLFLKKLT